MLIKYLTQTTFYLALLMLASSANGQESPQPERSTDSLRGSITGTVLGDTGQPVMGASVVIRRINAFGGAARQVTTNSEGKFEAAQLEQGLYSVTATVPALVQQPHDRDAMTPVYRVGDSVRLDLIRGGVITGTVMNPSGDPVIQIRVRALLVREANGQESKGLLPTFGSASTDDRGVFRIYGLPPGTYIIEAGAFGYTASGIITPYDFDGATFAPGSTRDNATEITVSSGQESTIDIRYRSEPGHIVSGTVTNAGTTGASISLVPANGGWLSSSQAFQRPNDRGFAIYGVADGVYDVIAQQSTPVPGAAAELSFSEGRRITVKGSDVTGIEMVTKPLGSITGTLVLQPTTHTECAGKRRPLLSEIMISAQQHKGNGLLPIVFQRTIASATPETDGSISWKNLLPGHYSFAPRFFARYWYLQSIILTTLGAASAKSALSNQKVDAVKNWTTLKPGERLTGLTITLAEGAGSIRGRLAVPESTTPPAKLNVYLVPAEKEKSEDVLRYFGVNIAGDRSFNVDGLPPGRYWILAQPPLSPDFRLSELRLPDVSQTRTKIRVAAELNKNEIEIKPCQNVSDYQLRYAPQSKERGEQ
jgi:carboxypeptidase family protein